MPGGSPKPASTASPTTRSLPSRPHRGHAMGNKQEVQVVTDALHVEATKWRRLAGDMDGVRGNADRLELSASAFFIGDMVSTAAHSSAYNDFRTYMVSLFAGAVTEF